MGNTFGVLFRITTWGESHGKAVGVVVDGCPPHIPIEREEIQLELDRRRPGQSAFVSPRKELDEVELLSGVSEGRTLGTPITMLVWNKDAKSKEYDPIQEVYRPGHADYTYEKKYGIQGFAGKGRASARETVGRVAAGALAKKVLKSIYGTEVIAWTEVVHKIKASIDLETLSLEQVEASPVRCPDPDASQKMMNCIEEAKASGDSVGGIIGCIAKNVPAGFGEPVFDKLEADLAKALLSLPACKGFEVGSGFSSADLKGSEHNDLFATDAQGNILTTTNRSGGIQGGISNGMPIHVRAAFKPPSTIQTSQATLSSHLKPTILSHIGRHDPCVLPRAVPIVESMIALVLVDHALRQHAFRHNI